MVWWSGKVFIRYNGYMNLSLYQQLLTTHLTSHTSNRCYRFFYQDNIPLHRTPTMLTWVENNRLELLDISGYLSEFNVIEYV